MEWFSQNWVWVLIFVAFIAMHLFGHGGHGGHGGRSDGAEKDSRPADKDDALQSNQVINIDRWMRFPAEASIC